MHDLFDVLGLPSDAPIGEIRRVCAQRVRRPHPDFRQLTPLVPSGAAESGMARLPREAAIDFVEMAALLERIERSFFHDPS